jgi:hypothetical protein
MNAEDFLKKAAYADGERKIEENNVTIFDGGKPYKFPMKEAAGALGLSQYNIMGVSEKLLGFRANAGSFGDYSSKEDDKGYKSPF